MKTMQIKWQFFRFMLIMLLCALNISGEELDRLPRSLKPEKYKLKISASMEDGTNEYFGSVRIKVYCEENTSLIVVNQRGLVIYPNSVWVRPFTEPKEKMNTLNIVRREPVGRDKYEIEMAQELEEKNFYEIKIKFSKRFLRNPENAHETGFLRVDQYFAFTRTNELGAKYVFPCFDQVDMKAKFQIILRHPHYVKGLANGYRKSYDDRPGVTKFKETENLATSSIAFVLIESKTNVKQDFISSSSSSKIRVRTYEYNDIKQYSADVHKIVCRVLEFYAKTFSLPDSIEKLDVFVAAHMSLDSTGHYGFLFMSPSEAEVIITEDWHILPQQKYEVFSKLCRSISQQWIGNIVTMSNWYDTWLLEGFNFFFQVKCVNEFRSDLKHRFSDIEMMNSFVELLEMGRKGRYNEISVIEVNPQFKFNKFNQITKNKINVLVRMMDFFMRSDKFNANINNVLKRFKFSNLKIDDIWNTFTETMEKVEAEVDESEVDEADRSSSSIIKLIMEPWMTQIDIPLITVTKIEGENEITITQETFPLLHEHKVTSIEEWKRTSSYIKQCWNIPLSFTTKVFNRYEKPSVIEWLMCNKGRLTIESARLTEDVWYILNTEMKVLARIDYDRKNWLLIQQTLLDDDDDDYSGLDVVTRTQLVSDLFALAEIGRVSYTILFDTMKYLSREDEYPPWKVALKEFKKIWTLLLRTDYLEPFEEYVRGILKPIFKKREEYRTVTEFSFKDTLKYQMQLLFMELSCKFSMEACKKNSQKIRNIWKKHPEQEFSEQIPLHMNEMVHCDGVKHKKSSYRKSLRKRYNKNSPITFQSEYKASVIFTALGCAEHTDTLERYLQLSINKEYVLNNHSFKIFKSLISNKKGYPLMKTFLKNNLEKIAIYYENNDSDIVLYFKVLLEVTNTEEDMKELMEFAKDSSKIDMSDLELLAAEEIAKYNIKWLTGVKNELTSYFNVRR